MSMTLFDGNMKPDLDGLENWSGDVNELARVAAAILAARGLGIDSTEPNVRVIRDYAQRGIVSRGERQGKEAIYGQRQLLELVAARVLVADGWPLAKIAEHFALIGTSELRSLILGSQEAPPSKALALARRLREEARLGSAQSRSAGLPPPSPSEEFGRRAAHLSSLQAELREALRQLGLPEDAPAVEQLTLIAVAPWCQLLIDSDRLGRLTIEEAEAIGRAVAATLLTVTKKGN
jgi:hypothetical protein